MSLWDECIRLDNIVGNLYNVAMNSSVDRFLKVICIATKSFGLSGDWNRQVPLYKY